MSRAFVKEDDRGTPDEPPLRAPSPHPNRVTAHGLAQLRERLARGQAALAAATEDERPRRRRELAALEARIAGAVLVPPPAERSRAGFGATVTLRDEQGGRHRYRIVGEDEAAGGAGLVAWTAPLAQALDGARAGDVVVWPRPAGDLEVEVLAVEYEAAGH